MRILDTYCDIHRSKNKIKEDILDIGKVLNILKNDSTTMNDDGILYTWRNSYNNNKIIIDVADVAQALKIIKREHDLDWKKV